MDCKRYHVLNMPEICCKYRYFNSNASDKKRGLRTKDMGCKNCQQGIDRWGNPKVTPEIKQLLYKYNRINKKCAGK